MEKIRNTERVRSIQWSTFEEYIRHTLPYMTKGEETAERTATELIEIIDKLNRLNIWDFSYSYVTHASFNDHPIVNLINEHKHEYRMKNPKLYTAQPVTPERERTNQEFLNKVYSLMGQDSKNLTTALTRYIKDRKTVRDIIAERIAQIQKELEGTQKTYNKALPLGVIQEHFNTRLTDLSWELISQTYKTTHPAIVGEFYGSSMPLSMSHAFAKEVTTAKITISKFLFANIMGYAHVHKGEHPTDTKTITRDTFPHRSKFSTIDGVLLVNHHSTCPAIHSAEQLATYLIHSVFNYWQETSIAEE